MGRLLKKQVAELLDICREQGLRLRTAESCTAGAIAAAIASVPGASDVLDRGWVAYSNRAKCEELGVDAKLIEAHGAVSREVVEAMARGGMTRGGMAKGSGANRTACVAVSGVAGPGGGTGDKPVGTVWIALAWPERGVLSHRFSFSGDRKEILKATVVQAVEMLLEAARAEPEVI